MMMHVCFILEWNVRFWDVLFSDVRFWDVRFVDEYFKAVRGEQTSELRPREGGIGLCKASDEWF